MAVPNSFIDRFELTIRAIHWLLVTRCSEQDTLSIRDLPRVFADHFGTPLQWEKLLGKHFTSCDVAWLMSNMKKVFVVADDMIYPVPVLNPRDFDPPHREVLFRVLHRRVSYCSLPQPRKRVRRFSSHAPSDRAPTVSSHTPLGPPCVKPLPDAVGVGATPALSPQSGRSSKTTRDPSPHSHSMRRKTRPRFGYPRSTPRVYAGPDMEISTGIGSMPTAPVAPTSAVAPTGGAAPASDVLPMGGVAPADGAASVVDAAPSGGAASASAITCASKTLDAGDPDALLFDGDCEATVWMNDASACEDRLLGASTNDGCNASLTTVHHDGNCDALRVPAMLDDIRQERTEGDVRRLCAKYVGEGNVDANLTLLPFSDNVFRWNLERLCRS
eukprot:GEMP01063987.1.p1 GENE.GEMP01063987.1~~GEMP01063987.1.p1  ORF type:complete len:386 (+),score=81.79 GEMP01063987.1:95-1252(+)